MLVSLGFRGFLIRFWVQDHISLKGTLKDIEDLAPRKPLPLPLPNQGIIIGG